MIRPLSIAFGIALLTGCGGNTPPEAAAPQASPPQASPPQVAASTPSPCALIGAEEVAAVIGPLAGAPYRDDGFAPSVDGDLCRFETTDLRSATLRVKWQRGAREISLLNMASSIVKDSADSDARKLHLIDGTTLAGEWDEARVVGCCELRALRGDTLVKVDVGGTRAMLAGAATLADAAIRRLEQPLAVDDRAPVAAALERNAARPAPRSVCELLPRADAEAVAGKALEEAPRGDEKSCTYVVPLGFPGSTLSIKLNVLWRDGFRGMAGAASIFGQTSALIGLPTDDGAPGDAAAADQNQGPWDEISHSIVGVMAVKRDVLFSVENGPLGQDVVEAFIAKAIENLGN